MKLRLFGFLFLAAFFIEIASIIFVGKHLGVLSTLFLLFLGMVIGASLMAKSGRDMIVKIQQELAEGRNPDQHMITGFMIFIAGVLFFIPGFVTDILAIILLIPFVQSKFWIYMKKHSSMRTKFYTNHTTNNHANYSTKDDGEIIIDLDSDDYRHENPQNNQNKYINHIENDNKSK